MNLFKLKSIINTKQQNIAFDELENSINDHIIIIYDKYGQEYYYVKAKSAYITINDSITNKKIKN